jgi:hypothetical protein
VHGVERNECTNLVGKYEGKMRGERTGRKWVDTNRNGSQTRNTGYGLYLIAFSINERR